MPNQINPDIWDEPEMHRALAARDITTVYRLLCGAGLSQTQISRLTGQSQSEVSEILNGRRVLAYRVLERIAEGLGIPRGHLGLAYADAAGNLDAYPGEGDETDPDPEVDEVISRRFLGLASAAMLGDAVLNGPIMQSGAALLGEPGGIRLLNDSAKSLEKLDKQDVAWIKSATDRFRELGSEYGGTAIYGTTRGMAEQVVSALQNSEPAQQGRRDLYIAASGLCRVTAWAAFESGHQRQSWQCHATALDLARESGDIDTVMLTIQYAGRAEIHSGRHQAAAKLFELISVRRQLDAVTWGLLGDAYAPNSPESARNAIRHMPDAEGANSADAISMGGHVNSKLGNYQAAIEAYQRVPSRPSLLALQDIAPMSIAHLRAGETRIGVEYAEQALTLAEGVRSAAATNVLQGMGRVLAAQKDSTAQDLAQRISASTAA